LLLGLPHVPSGITEFLDFHEIPLNAHETRATIYTSYILVCVCSFTSCRISGAINQNSNRLQNTLYSVSFAGWFLFRLFFAGVCSTSKMNWASCKKMCCISPNDLWGGNGIIRCVFFSFQQSTCEQQNQQISHFSPGQQQTAIKCAEASEI
jgi:hypothetical protein